MAFPGWIVVGLGNPGSRYSGTRHDIGFMLLDRLASKHGASLSRNSDDREAEISLPVKMGGGDAALLVKPLAYMNLSGKPLQRLMARERVPPSRVLVACDDINLPLGKLRLRPDGSAGGHNGLRSIIECIGDGFPRLRMGVGREPEGVDRADWVLSRFEPGERETVDQMLIVAEGLVELVLAEGVEVARARAGG